MIGTNRAGHSLKSKELKPINPGCHLAFGDGIRYSFSYAKTLRLSYSAQLAIKQQNWNELRHLKTKSPESTIS